MKRKKMKFFILSCVILLIFFFSLSSGLAEQPANMEAQGESTETLAKQSQNPIADLISVPLQNNFNFNVGPENKMQYVGNIQPVIPLNATENWNIITRTIAPIVHQPELASNFGDVTGLSDIQFSAFLSPAKSGDVIWGVGPIVQFPTGTDNSITASKWGAGPTAVGVYMRGHWVAGTLVNYFSSFAGQDDRGAISQWLIQPFCNYNLPHGWYLASSPLITANMMAEGSQQWTVPLGGGVGRLVFLGKLPLNLSLQGYYNVVHPDFGPEWSIRISVAVLLPKSIFKKKN